MSRCGRLVNRNNSLNDVRMEKTITKKNSVWKIIGIVCIALILLLVGYNLIRYPLKAPLSSIIGMDAEQCELQVVHYGKTTPIQDESIKHELFKSLEGNLSRSFVGDWIMKTSGPEWTLALSNGNKEVRIGIDPGLNGGIPRIFYEHYYYTLENATPKALNQLLSSIMQ